jgi:hypothetical protein
MRMSVETKLHDLGDAIDRSVAERSELRGLVHRLGAMAVRVCDALQDEGDRCYLGSTNHADTLRDMKQLYDEYRMETGDMGEDTLDN